MNLNAVPLFERAKHVASVRVSPTMEVTVIDDTVDAVTGEPAELSADMLLGMDLLQTVSFLHEKFAGDAVFVIQTPQAFAVVRPPFSELPVFYHAFEDRVDVWSGLKLPESLRRRPPGFDLAYLSVAMHNWSWMTPRTGLLGVFELLSGGVLVFDGRALSQQDLLAKSILKLPYARNQVYEEQVAAIRRLIFNSVRHKIGSHLDHTSVLCSGGVDSSVGAVAAAALYPDRKFPLIHCYSEDHLHGDERFYCEAVAERLGWQMATVDMNAGASRTHLSPDLLVHTARPMKSAAALSTMAALKGLAKSYGAHVLLSGDGGDQLFLLNDPMLYCREVVNEAPTPTAALRSISELASMGRMTIWDVAGEAFRSRRAARLREHYFGKLRFPKNPLAVNPVPDGTQVVPAGALLSSLGVSRAFQYFGMRNAELNNVPLNGYPVDERKTFLFWPLIREAISAKRSHHLKDGRDRAIERDAFRPELPPEVYHRFSKGGSRDLVERYDFDSLINSLQKSAVLQYGLITEQIKNIKDSQIDDDMAFALVAARGFADWMELYA